MRLSGRDGDARATSHIRRKIPFRLGDRLLALDSTIEPIDSDWPAIGQEKDQRKGEHVCSFNKEL